MTVTLITGNPTIVLLAQQKIEESGVMALGDWVRLHRPDCVPARGFHNMWGLLPHDEFDTPHGATPTAQFGPHRQLSDNEVLAEIAGRKCYDSFADAAGKKTNEAYFQHIMSMDPLHSSILYHAKMTFFFGGVSRKFSHQFIRNYVGSDRDEEGSPSQESTRFTHHYGWYVVPPHVLDAPESARLYRMTNFRRACEENYKEYSRYLRDSIEHYCELHNGVEPKGSDRKEIYEAGAGLLNMSAETSFVWTTNPMALRKFLKERVHGAADAEIQRFGRVLARLCFDRWPNLFLGADLDGVRAEVKKFGGDEQHEQT